MYTYIIMFLLNYYNTILLYFIIKITKYIIYKKLSKIFNI